MQVDILYRPSYSMADVKLTSGEQISVEAGSMVAMSTDLQVQTKMKGGLMKSLARSVLGGESFFMNTYQAGGNGGEIQLAPTLPGDVFTMDLSGESYLVQSGSFPGFRRRCADRYQMGRRKDILRRRGIDHAALLRQRDIDPFQLWGYP